MESLATYICLVTLNCRSLSNEFQQAALSSFCDICMHRALHCRQLASVIALSSLWTSTPPTAATLMKEKCYKNSCQKRLQQLGRRVWFNVGRKSVCTIITEDRKSCVVSAHAPLEHADDNNKDGLYHEFNTLK
ncbi:hypothetical protein RB195_017614 [Necator americanus]